MKFAFIAAAAFAVSLEAQTTITIDRNAGAAATTAFAFPRVASPARSDAATAATVTLLGGSVDSNSAGLAALIDGALPASPDQPSANLFFKPNSWGGRVRFDLGKNMRISEIRSYSWHPDTRAPQVYKVFASDGKASGFDAAPSTKLDPATCGWTLVAFVDTRTQEGNSGGQYAVSVKASPDLGAFRYLLFDFFETESDDPWGQTFYSELDVEAAASTTKR